MAADDDAPASEEDVADNLFDDSAEADAPEAEEAPAHPRARVIKVKRADIDAAIASGALEEVEDSTAESTLSAEDEAELLAELAEVEAELPISEDVDTDIDGDADIDEVEAQADTSEEPEAVKDDDVQRLMAEAENQMDEPEGSRRRNAFQHLKAAVMAKKADADIGKKDEEEEEGAFRSDLASVVKPRRPEARSEGAKRPSSDRPAPLKLVAEQRVDVDAAPKGPVTPRRVAAMDDGTSTEDAGNFADYASEMGAHDLPSLLEAAASYLSFVEGRDQFSRPQLMTKVRQVEQGDFSREDGLRSFGQLLRAGKIEKIRGGRFAVTGDIGYRPDQREAG
ncbi:hypothetical protein FZX02_00870 [Synechococcus sp. MU1644]|nr:hypothetical protein [Synechococcus sp. MU1644]